MMGERTRPFFSIIIPIYNIEKYLNDAIKSVLNQTFGNFELILIDDGSLDKCPDICDKYAAQDRRIKVVHRKNAGVVEARKVGASIAKGLYLIPLDGDDWLELSALQDIYNIITFNQEPDIICFRIIESNGIHECKNKVYNHPGYYSRKDIEKDILPMLIQKEDATYFAPSVCSKAIKTDLFIKCQNQVSSSVLIGEDSICTALCVYNASSIYIMSDYLYYYRIHIESITKKHKALSMELPKYYAENVKRVFDDSEFDYMGQLYRKVVHELFFVIVSQFNRKDSYFNIRKDIILVLKDPFFEECIKNAQFKNSKKACLMMIALKHKFIILFRIYHIVKQKRLKV